MSRRAPALSEPNAVATAHTLALLSEYTHTLDSLPLDLSRHFADLRELDAVLSSSMATLTTKIAQLTTMLEDKLGTKQDRLWLLAEIAEEATRLKLGGEDKIRVACLAADGLRAHRTHMGTLLEMAPDRDFFNTTDLLGRKTVYPHVATRSYMPVGMAGEGGRRQRRGAYGSLLAHNAVEASPNKRKRAAGRDDDEAGPSKTPRKERNTDVAPRPRNGARARKYRRVAPRNERAASPTESLLSVASHLPNPFAPAQTPNGHSRQAGTARAGGASNKRRAANATTDAHVGSHADTPSRRDAYHPPPSSSAAHPSLPVPYAAGVVNGVLAHTNGAHVVTGAVAEWAPGQLEGPGMPPARSFVGVTAVVDGPDFSADGGADPDGEADDGRTYCVCNRISYGDMIACDDATCEKEWFHLPCIGLAAPPAGEWYCDACRAKRNSQRARRNGKKRAGGGRSNARNTSA
ncbi:hypothetical protein CERSUDRAFT_68570 [Gelatoporia subvermispora B]|uniref:Chromatin modification-related protein n=1 Tax=Ceriporiopsis subvermispora (strain B) TaxID=914234 RepID=M2QK96_CERS8|nr:hypothetical protein CERSUDRAFT_68570 [Gelatoporia subvermispora B]